MPTFEKPETCMPLRVPWASRSGSRTGSTRRRAASGTVTLSRLSHIRSQPLNVTVRSVPEIFISAMGSFPSLGDP
ncbi:hypothetical protein GA0115250_10559 [Streptomyces sp. BvitLS-983]|nr:hypothetical protein GA0115250_10559 [Streptomyces sp. BvitLS-983]